MFEAQLLRRVFKAGFLYQLCLAPHLEQLEVFERVRGAQTQAHELSNVKRQQNIQSESPLRNSNILFKS